MYMDKDLIKDKVYRSIQWKFFTFKEIFILDYVKVLINLWCKGKNLLFTVYNINILFTVTVVILKKC